MSGLTWKRKKVLQYLNGVDVFILTAIMFGIFIWNSLLLLLYPSGSEDMYYDHYTLEFTSSANWYALKIQGLLLVLAIIYLLFRRFDFSRWKIKITFNSILRGIGLFIVLALLFDVYFMYVYGALPYFSGEPSSFYSEEGGSLLLNKLEAVDVSLVLYSILNGLYEEFFFLGICLSVPMTQRKYYFLYTLFLRYFIHTYQGHISAVAIGLFVGGIYYYAYTRMKEQNLFPFFLSHTIADILGIGIIGYLV